MPRNITVTFEDGEQIRYDGAPDNITPADVQRRAEKESGKRVASIDGGMKQEPAPSGGTMEPVPDWGVKHPKLYGVYGAAKEVGKAGLEMAAVGAGAAGGAVMAGPVGGLTGAGIGYGTAKLLENRLSGDREAGFDPKDMLLGAAMELIPMSGRGAMKIARKYVIPSKEDYALAQLYKKFGVKPLPSESRTTPSKSLSVLESVLGYSPFSGDVMTKNALERMGQYNDIRARLIERGATEKELEKIGTLIKNEAKTIIEAHEGRATQRSKQLVDDFASRYLSTSRYQAGSTVGDLLEGVRIDRAKNVSELYGAVDDMLGDSIKKKVQVSTETQKLAKSLLDDELSKMPSLRNQKLISILNDWLPKKVVPQEVEEQLAQMSPAVREKVLSQIETEKIPKISWRGLDKSRSELLDQVRSVLKANRGMPTNESRVMSELAESIDRDMGKMGEEIGGDVGSAILEARAASKALHAVYDKDILGIMHRKPHEVVSVALKDPKTFLSIKNAVGRAGIQPIKSVFIQDILDKSIAKNGFVDGARIAKALNALHPEIKNGLLSKAEQDQLLRLAKESDAISKQFTKRGKNEAIKFLETIVGTSNEKVLDAIFKEKNSLNIRLAKKLFSEQRLTELSEQALQKVLKVSPDGNMLPVQSAKMVQRFNVPLKELLPKDLYNDLGDFMRIVRNSDKVEKLALNASQTGQVFVGYNIAQQFMKSPVSVIKTLGMPWALSKIYVSSTAREYLKKAILHSPNEPASIANFIRAFEIAIVNEAQKTNEEQ